MNLKSQLNRLLKWFECKLLWFSFSINLNWRPAVLLKAAACLWDHREQYGLLTKDALNLILNFFLFFWMKLACLENSEKCVTYINYTLKIIRAHVRLWHMMLTKVNTIILRWTCSPTFSFFSLFVIKI